jgi:serine/threonine protein kinase
MGALEQLIGQKLGQYQIIEQVGEGGMSVVFRARQASLNRDVALKVLQPQGFGRAVNLDRFVREAQAIGNLHHPNILPVYDSGQEQGYAYIAMRYVPQAVTLANLMSQPLATAQILPLAEQIAAALDFAHQAGIIHRDVKPGNILLDGDWALLSDFGLAKMMHIPSGLTHSSGVMGTPAYMSPEQAQGQPLDHRTDIYALGIILFEMLTGQIPHDADTPLAILLKRINEPLPRPRQLKPELSEAVEQVLLKSLAANPAHRFQSAGDLYTALKTALGRQSFRQARLKKAPLAPGQPASPSPSWQRNRPARTTTPPSRPSPGPAANPFFYGGAVPSHLFYGRQEIVAAIVQRVGGRTAQSISLVGQQRMGKTSIFNYLKAQAEQLFPPELPLVIIYIDLSKAYCHTQVGLMRALRRELSRAWREPWPASDDNDLSAFDFALEDLQAENIRLVLCLDQLEHLTERAGEFEDVLEDWRACGSLGQMAMITASTQPLADLCLAGGLVSPFYNIFNQRWLGLLPQAEWQRLVSDHLQVTPDDLTFIEQVAGGHPFFTQMAASYLWEAKHQKEKIDYRRLYEALWGDCETHLQHLWRKLKPTEQVALYQAGPGAPQTNPHLITALEQRGLMREGRPFSQMFAELIRQEQPRP